jgi:signal transduction histidine kinase/ActR/RegA family two-component response regulator
MKKLVTIAAALCLVLGLKAQTTPFNYKHSKGQLYEYAEFANAGHERYAINKVIQDSVLQFKPLQSENQSVGFTSSHFWMRFLLENTDDETKTYFLQTARPITDEVDLYQITNGDIKHYKSGDQIPFNERQVSHRASVFKIKLSAKSSSTFYLHLKSDGETINLPLNLYTESEFLLVNNQQQLFLGIFYGLLLLAGFIYLFFYSSLLEKTFLYYSLYVFSIALLQASLDGLIFEYILPNGFLNSKAVLITALLSNFFLLKYCASFLKIKERLRVVHYGFQFIYGCLAVLFIMVLISPQTMELSYPLSNVNGLLSLLLILTALGIMYVKRIPVDTYFSFGILFLVIGLLGFVMNNLSMLPNNFVTLNSAKFGSGFEVIFLSLSMTNLIRKLREEKELSQEQALKKSQEISELKSYFMSNMSHELRTPINAIMGIAEEQLASLKTVEDKKNYELIKHASLSLLSSVNDILDYEKIEKNQLILREEAFNPFVSLTQISNNWETQAQNKGLAYQLEIPQDFPKKACGDADRFQQIINNILSNAVKFTTHGHICFKANWELLPDDKYLFSFIISDTGVGMDTKRKEHVFDSFSQMRLDNKRRFGGVGLGLNIVNHLVNLFNGKIRIDSIKGEGTQVTLELPMKAIINKSSEINNESKEKLIHNTVNILVVEDNVMNQMIMKKLLSKGDNITFEVVNNGAESIEALKKAKYHLILMDLQMPVMDGFEATKIIRSGEIGKQLINLPIIAVTADTMDKTRQKVFDLGMNDYMTKPVKFDLLIEKINQFRQAV